MFHGRTQNKIQNPYTLPDIYQEYIKDIKENSPYYIDYLMFVEITTTYFKKIVNVVMEKSMSFYLPCRVGSFQIVKKKTKPIGRSFVNWPETERLGKRVLLTNAHTNGYKYLWFWDRHNGGVSNEYLYRFVPSRANKRKLAYILKNRMRDYFEHDYK
jgi:hypothetical protein